MRSDRLGETLLPFAREAVLAAENPVRRGLERIEEGELEVALDVDDGSEVGLLQAGFSPAEADRLFPLPPGLSTEGLAIRLRPPTETRAVTSLPSRQVA